ncbi:alpha/beta hydrolase family protein [Paenibacillus thalictri]|uniref:Alpha/beta hydrolase n=1 Tax=Paenibacillus thalictri TaxID=2527873 RepID=A0A4Q9DLG8_9BACL|nr:alpha/beta family hydrolase [Paenibacillus thalictri]TBL75270.1 alpha/beta hydrolase [Paenibacillus thalictri]
MSHAAVTKDQFQIALENNLVLNGELETTLDGTAKPVLLLSHGFRGHKDWAFWPYVSRWFAERGYYTVRIDFSRIHAKNNGADEAAVQQASTLSRELDDVNALLSELIGGKLPLAEQADTSRIAVLGHSRAGASSIIFASEHSGLAAAVVWNGGVHPYPPAGAAPAPVVLEDLQQNLERFDTPRLLAQLETPVLIVQGGADSARLVEGVAALREAAPQITLVTIDGADHSFGISHPFAGTNVFLEEALEITSTFLAETLNRQRQTT